MTTVNAQDSMKAGAAAGEFVKKYENVKDVDCMTISKRSGLGMAKMMLNKQLGKDFMKGVNVYGY